MFALRFVVACGVTFHFLLFSAQQLAHIFFARASHTRTESKRQTLKQKYKVQKKVKEHKRKLNKLAKQNPHLRKRTFCFGGVR